MEWRTIRVVSKDCGMWRAHEMAWKIATRLAWSWTTGLSEDIEDVRRAFTAVDVMEAAPNPERLIGLVKPLYERALRMAERLDRPLLVGVSTRAADYAIGVDPSGRVLLVAAGYHDWSPSYCSVRYYLHYVSEIEHAVEGVLRTRAAVAHLFGDAGTKIEKVA